MEKKLTENLKRIEGVVAEACARRNRSPQDVQLIAVTKSVDTDTIAKLLSLGQRHLGESKVQDLIDRHEAIRQIPQTGQNHLAPARGPDHPEPVWHMMGHLQRNKVKPLLPIVSMIHSVDSLRLVEEINTTAARLGLSQKVNILLQVNTSKEKDKFGLAVGAVVALTEQVVTLPNLALRGLMTMTPLDADEQTSRFCFGRCRELYEEILGEKIVASGFDHLSMGMSQDYALAVEEGATMIRIGSAIFE